MILSTSLPNISSTRVTLLYFTVRLLLNNYVVPVPKSLISNSRLIFQ